jgi:RND family efflux transporter MFP subunit
VPLLEVRAERLQPQDYTVVIQTQGTVRARTSGTIIPEVSGRIVHVSAQFREGGFFDAGDVLVEIDDSNYRTALAVAEANLADAKVQLAEEEARGVQARLDWERLGRGEAPSDLVLRLPQLLLAQAEVAASQARLEEARRDLDRTRIRAPYEGRVLRKFADIGQVVGLNTVLAEIYAVDYAEVRLPLTNQQYAMLDLPPVQRGSDREHLAVPATLSATFGSERSQWDATVVRVEGAIDTDSRQIFVVAQVDDPTGARHAEPLRIGLFVEAALAGRVLPDVYVLPRTALREGRFVVTIQEEDNSILRVPVEPLWATADEVVFREPTIAPGTMVSLTPMAIAVDGMTVRPVGNDGARTARTAP